jgi:guanidinopropionase
MVENDESIGGAKFSGIASFFGAPQADGLDGIDIGLIGVPFDMGVTNRAGARHGPRELRNQSTMILGYHQLLDIAPAELCRIADIGDCPISHKYHLEDGHADIQSFYEAIHAAGIIPLTAGGDHSITLPVFRALSKGRPLGMVHFDAHCDTADAIADSKFHHGAPFRIAVEEGLLDPTRTVQIGIRGSLSSKGTWQFSHDSGMRVVYMDELYDRGCRTIMEEARKIVGDGPTYISFDVDGLDPVYTPGTGTPEIGGFTTLEAQMMLRALRGLDLVGGDLVEVAPPFDPSGNTSLVGAGIMFEILCLLADAVVSRKHVPG